MVNGSEISSEESYTVDGLHEAIVTPAVFYEVQDVLDGRKRKTATKIVAEEMLALKGSIICPRCGRMLTGSASKGKTKYIHYYHCKSTCSYRKNAVQANELFIAHLQNYELNEVTATWFKKLILEEYGKEHQQTGETRKQYIERITVLNNKVTKAREPLLNEDIDASDFRAVKVEAEREISVLECKIAELHVNKMGIAEVEKTLDSALLKLTDLQAMYSNSDNYQKQKIVSSIYPEKFTIEDLKDKLPNRVKYLNGYT